jgi:hypothetical protein
MSVYTCLEQSLMTCTLACLTIILACSDCCQLSCNSNCSLFDGGILLKCSAWTDYPTDTAGQTRVWGSTNTGSILFSIWCLTVNLCTDHCSSYLYAINFCRMLLHGLSTLSPRLWSNKKQHAMVPQNQMPQSPAKVI